MVEEEHEYVGDLAVEEARYPPDEVSDVVGDAIGHRSRGSPASLVSFSEKGKGGSLMLLKQVRCRDPRGRDLDL